jgi:hypothetical protein
MAGCGIGGVGAGPGNGNDDGTEPGIGANMPAYCEEFRREAVVDLAVAPDGFAFPAAEAVDAQAGTFAGDLVVYAEEGDGPAIPASLTVTVTEVEAVYSELVDPRGGDTGLAMGAPEQEGTGDCMPYYALAVSAAIASEDGAVAESFATESRAWEPTAGMLYAGIALADVLGTARPELDPDEWDAVALQIDANLQDGGWAGSLTWMASNDTSDDTDSWTYDTATGVGSGTVGVSGMTEPLGTFNLAR